MLGLEEETHDGEGEGTAETQDAHHEGEGGGPWAAGEDGEAHHQDGPRWAAVVFFPSSTIACECELKCVRPASGRNSEIKHSGEMVFSWIFYWEKLQIFVTEVDGMIKIYNLQSFNGM